MLDCYVINLDRQPERLAEFSRINADCGLAIQRFSAFDGAVLDEATRWSLVRRDDGRRYTRNIVACALSHKTLWERVAQGVDPTVIFEDDAVIRSDAAEKLPGLLASAAERGEWDIILLGANGNSVFNFKPDETDVEEFVVAAHPSTEALNRFREITGKVLPRRIDNAFGTCGYVLSPSGARMLLDRCFPMDDRLLSIGGLRYKIRAFGIDSMMNAFYPSIHAYLCWPPLVMTANINSATRVASNASA